MADGLLHPKPISLFRVMWESGLFLNCNVYWPCPTACRYCYSMLNRASHNTVGKSATDKALGTLVSLVNKVFGPRYDETDLLQYLLHERYPVMMSNNSDPLSNLECEHGYTKQYLDLLADVGVPVNLLSKWQGWSGLNQDAYIETFKRFDRFWASITITADNDACRRKWEPGGTTVDERFAIIKQLTSAGIDVDVRVIPFIFSDSFPGAQWDDPAAYRPFVERCKDAGAFAISVAPLDFGIYDAKSCDAVCKEWVAEHQWCKSEDDKRFKYHVPDLDIWQAVTEIWQAECARVGVKCGPHQVFASLLPDGQYSCVVNTPDWVDHRLSWVRAVEMLRGLQLKYGAPVATLSQNIAEWITWEHPMREQRFKWSKVRDLIPNAPSNQRYAAKMLHDNDGCSIVDIMRLQMDHITWPDSLFEDACITPIAAAPDSHYENDEFGVLIAYDAYDMRNCWSHANAADGYSGRPAEELIARGAVSQTGHPFALD